jgi:hypothetical protein
MTILNAGAAAPQSSSNPAPSVAIVGIAAGASVVGVLGVAFAIAYSRRTPKHKLVNPVYHDETVEIKNNPARTFERQRSMSFPPEPEVVVPRMLSNGIKNPFAAKTTSMKFAPTVIRTSYDLPPPPPPSADV